MKYLFITLTNKELVLVSTIGGLLVLMIIMFAIIRHNGTKQLNRTRYFDPLTGLHNRQGFKKYFKKPLKNISAVIMIDIQSSSNLKFYLGDKAFDELVCRICGILKAPLIKRDDVAHFESDFFLVGIRETTETQVRNYISEVQNKVTSLSEKVSNVSLRFGVCIGVEPVEVLLDNAEFAWKYAKRNNERSIYYTKDIASVDEAFRRVISKPSLIRQEFAVYYQPKINCSNGEIVGAEALLRWVDSKGRVIIYPNQFIPEFEENGFITSLDLFVLDEVCKVLESFQKRNIKPISISVNFSRNDFKSITLLDDFDAILSRYTFDRKYLHIEITESATITNKELISNAILHFKSAGVDVEMDDFGSGYSSLGYLKDATFPVIKIDRVFVEGNLKLKSEQTILRTLIKMITGLGLQVVVEGVETAYVVRQIRNMAKDVLIQGFYFYKPMPYLEFDRILQDSRFYQDDLFSEPIRLDKEVVEVIEEEKKPKKEEKKVVEPEVVKEEVKPVVEVKKEEQPKEIIKEVVVEKPVEVVKEVVVEKPVEVIKEVVVEKPVYVEKKAPVTEDDDDDDTDEEEDDDIFDDSMEDDETEEERFELLLAEFKKKFKKEWESEMLKKYPQLLKRHYSRKAFIEKLMNLAPEKKANYNELKNLIMAHDGLKNRVTKNFDTFYTNKIVCKIGVVGKGVRLYLDLDPSQYPTGQFPHRDVSDKKRHKQTPFMMKITSPLSMRRAARLIDDLFINLKMPANPEYKQKDYIRSIQALNGKRKK